jgi:hypothetical protein
VYVSASLRRPFSSRHLTHANSAVGRLRERLLRVVSSEFSEQLPVAVHTSAEEVKKRLGQVQIGASSRAT